MKRPLSVAILGDGDPLLRRLRQEIIWRGVPIDGEAAQADDAQRLRAFVLGVRRLRVPSVDEVHAVQQRLRTTVLSFAERLHPISHGLILVRQPDAPEPIRHRLLAVLEETSDELARELREQFGMHFALNLLDLRPLDDTQRLARDAARWLTSIQPIAGTALRAGRRLSFEPVLSSWSPLRRA